MYTYLSQKKSDRDEELLDGFSQEDRLEIKWWEMALALVLLPFLFLKLTIEKIHAFYAN